MITETLMGIVASVLEWLMSLWPDELAPPGWLVGAVDSVVGLFSTVHSLGVWIPTDLAFITAAFLMQAYIGGGVVKGIRIFISHFTGGGGGAA